ncbi:MAG: hypothetical protein RIQ89_638 [Bacteroidota bacterium]|jgi:protein-L-isoaspartate(D-aspartate) O-methyltransferase
MAFEGQEIKINNITYSDSFRQQGMRQKLIQELLNRGIPQGPVLEAIRVIPRHYFLDPVFEHQAYEDIAFRIAADQTISQPYTVAFQTQLLEVKKLQKILEIGTGSGYQCAVLCHLGAQVFSLERQKELHDKAVRFLPLLGYRPKLFFGDGFKGLPSYGPFDSIIVTCGAPYVPPALIEQLANNGRLVIPVGEGKEQVMTLILKDQNGQITQTTFDRFKFVPMLQKRVST